MLPPIPPGPYFSPNPVEQELAWCRLYEETAPRLVRNLRSVCQWLSFEDAVSIVNDAFLAVRQSPIAARENGAILPLLLKISRRRAISLLRESKAKKRGEATVPLDTVNPASETDLEFFPAPPDIGVWPEVATRIRQLPGLQQAVAWALIDNPDCSSSEIAEAIAIDLSYKPTTDAVDSAKRSVRNKLKVYAALILKEISR